MGVKDTPNRPPRMYASAPFTGPFPAAHTRGAAAARMPAEHARPGPLSKGSEAAHPASCRAASSSCYSLLSAPLAGSSPHGLVLAGLLETSLKIMSATLI